MIRCGKTGAAILYGTKCVGCDCELAPYADGGVVSAEGLERVSERLTRDYANVLSRQQAERLGKHDQARVFGFDTASKPDQTATIKVQRVSDRYEFSVEDIKAATDPRLERLMRENEARLRRMREAAFARAVWGDVVDPPWGFEAPPRHANCRSRMDPRNGDGTAWTPPAQEIITDPNDRRGMDARPARVR